MDSSTDQGEPVPINHAAFLYMAKNVSRRYRSAHLTEDQLMEHLVNVLHAPLEPEGYMLRDVLRQYQTGCIVRSEE